MRLGMARTPEEIGCTTLLLAAVLLSACGGGAKSPYPAQERGCQVTVFDGLPPFPTANIGSVVAWCPETDTRDACVRELQDQVCLLGGNVLLQIEGPTPQATSDGMKQRMRGRAAHSK
jgi:hypothetical protein